MKPLRTAVAAVIVTAFLAVPAHGDHKRRGGFVFVEPFFVPVPERLFRGRLRQQDGYPVALVRQRLKGIGFYGIGQFDVYPGAYGVTATDPGGVRVNLVIDRWSGDIVRAREIEAGPAVRPHRPPAVVDRAPGAARKSAALHVPPLPRPAPERLTQTTSIAPSATDRLEPEEAAAARGGDIVTPSANRPDAAPEIGPIGNPAAMPPPVPGAGAEAEAEAEAEAPPPEVEAPVEIAAAPKPPAVAQVDRVAEAVTLSPAVVPTPAQPVTALQGERFDPADGRGPIADY